MSAKEPVVARSVATDDSLASAPIDPSWIIEGSPQARSRPLSFTMDGTLSGTLWESTAGRFEWHYDVDEVVHIIEGEVEVTSPNGVTTTLRRGDVVYFPGGQVMKWYVPEYVRKVALNSIRVSPLRRLAQRIPYARNVVHRLRATRSSS